MPSTLVIAIAVIVGTVLLGAVIAKLARAGKMGLPYRRSKALFSPAEQSFLAALDNAVGWEYRVFGKVRLADVAAVKSGLTKSARRAALNRVAAKHFDFVVCRASDLSPVCAVELTDSSHNSQRAQARDELVAKVCLAIGLPLLVFHASQAYSIPGVRARFTAAVSTAPHAAASG
ncbi:MAG: DUF2726 domain-containing protein [Rubrivivax sp.]